MRHRRRVFFLGPSERNGLIGNSYRRAGRVLGSARGSRRARWPTPGRGRLPPPQPSWPTVCSVRAGRRSPEEDPGGPGVGCSVSPRRYYWTPPLANRWARRFSARSALLRVSSRSSRKKSAGCRSWSRSVPCRSSSYLAASRASRVEQAEQGAGFGGGFGEAVAVGHWAPSAMCDVHIVILAEIS